MAEVGRHLLAFEHPLRLRVRPNATAEVYLMLRPPMPVRRLSQIRLSFTCRARLFLPEKAAAGGSRPACCQLLVQMPERTSSGRVTRWSPVLTTALGGPEKDEKVLQFARQVRRGDLAAGGSVLLCFRTSPVQGSQYRDEVLVLWDFRAQVEQ